MTECFEIICSIKTLY